ncbi:amino acid adenylation domain-containing protein [Tumebacillus sp. BK434]|uniref:non-ribosomal peptide synthetase n=1 Tax=Tumebacillus sp. BK434 TaxID=2512169 RepID=UPI001049F2E6|nr:non-ribosomal peptide synthetase [Tumebacillus sp. BK434]TCP54488.1 amino acid adenylation domain-containing protein [Tumebacillus sp. BK434]
MKNSLSDRLAALTPEQRAIFEKRAKAKNLAAEKLMLKKDRIPNRGHNNPSPLAIDQERLWFFHMMNPDEPTYNVYGAINMKGTLNAPVFEKSFNEIVRRHEAWRTTFEMIDGQPMQLVHKELFVPMELLDLTHLPGDEREEAAKKAMSDVIQIPFDLEQPPLVRTNLIRKQEDEWLFVLTVHHIVTDRVTFSIFFHEMMAHYKAFLNGQPSLLPEPQISYADFSEWQRQYLTGAVKDNLINFWKQTLDGSDFVLNIPTDYPRPAVQDFKGARVFLDIPLDTANRLKEIGKKEGASAFMTLLAVYYALLFRYTGQEDLLVGTPFANRNRGEMEGVIGYFLTSVVLRTQVQPDLTFKELLRRVKDVSLTAYANNDIPFGLLLDELKPPRDGSRNPIFQACFVYVDVMEDKLELPQLELKYELTDAETAKYDLTIGLMEVEEGITGFFEYAPAMFRKETIEQINRHWLKLIEAVIENPELKVNDMPLFSPDEEQQLLVEWNDTARPLPERPLLHELFEAQAAKTPEATALILGEETLTYGELNERANRLANYLQARGVEHETLVGVYMERSFEMIVSMLAVLKAGGAHIMLEPSYPQERLAAMIADAGMHLVLTQQAMLGRLPAHAAQEIAVDAAWPQIAAESAAKPYVEVGERSLAYIMYTSGSTGRPKGAMIEHRSVVNTMLHLIERFGITANDRLFLKSLVGFDGTVLEFYAPLLSGAAIVIAEEGGHHDVVYLIREMKKQAVTAMQMIPSVMNLLIETQGIEEVTSLKHLFLGGEAISPSLKQRIHERLPHVMLHNIYGPAETTVFSTDYTFVHSDDRAVIPIGRPIANINVYVLDTHLNPVPVGVYGELHIGGIGVMRGYLNRPELDAERFVPHPFLPDGGRLYKTGDIVRWLPDGTLEYQGRIDNQVKISGVRIEAGEVEGALLQHPSVQHAAVLVREDQPGQKRLVAYLIGEVTASNELREFLKTRLPDAMIPTAFLFVDEFPLSPNGKLDRSALPKPEVDEKVYERDYVAPRTDLEDLLAGIWREILALPKVGVQSNFFELGGQSLNAMQMIGRVRETFQIEVPVTKLFSVTTIAGLAELLTEYEQKPGQAEAIARLRKKLMNMTEEEKRAMLEAKKKVRG